MATITSQEEQDFLVNKFDNRSAATTGWGYLGGSDADSGTGYSSSTVSSDNIEEYETYLFRLVFSGIATEFT